ncbi:MAG TPA: hypothetical protein VGF40_07310 [Thermoanaerobaculia bacterium]
MRTLSVWFSSLFNRLVGGEIPVDGWRPVVGYHLAIPSGDGRPRVWLTLEEQWPRCVDAWPELADGDLRALTALLARPNLHWFNASTRGLATAPTDAVSRSALIHPTIAVLVRGFDASWTPGKGGWLRLRFLRGASYATHFAASDAERFTACVAAASAPNALYDPRMRSIRSRSDAAVVGELALAP